jgi:hypothetical protein
MKWQRLVNVRQFILLLTISMVAPALAAVPRADAPGLKRAIEVQKQHSPRLMGMAGVVGTAVGQRGDSTPVVKIYTEKPGVAGLPRVLNGVPVEVEVTGKIFKLPPKPPECKGPPPRPDYCQGGDDGQKVDPKGRFNPVPIGVSTGHPAVTAGTIGARVTQVGGSGYYALSNNHVYANENQASTGEPVLQPGTYDGGSSPADDIGHLSVYQEIYFCSGAASPDNCRENTIDAAIAINDTTRKLENYTPVDGYGIPCVTPTAASVGQAVQKYGRTTGLTKGTVDAISATFYVGYDQGTARFVDQVVIKGGGFSKGGDSGSLVVGEAQNRPVALLFAGGRGVTIANPIDAVLGRFGITIDGVACN